MPSYRHNRSLSPLPCRAIARLLAALAATGATLACSSSPASPPSANSDGSNSLTGSYSFPVSYSFIDAMTPQSQCNDTTTLPAGGYASFALLLSDVNPLNDAGTLSNFLPPGAHLVRIEIAGPGARTPVDAGPAAVTPGTYTVGFEGEDDDDLCMLPAGASAILDVFDFSADGSYSQATAATGTVTLTSVATGRIEGSFDVELSQSPFQITQPAIAFSGTFDAQAM